MTVRSLQFRIFLLFLVAALVPLVLVSGLYYWQASSEVVRLITDNYRHLAQRLSREIELMTADGRTQLEVLGRTSGRACDNLSEAMYRERVRTPVSDDLFEDVALVDRNGELMYTMMGRGELWQHFSGEAAGSVLAGRSRVLPVSSGRESGNGVLAIGYPLFDAAGQPCGGLVGVIRLGRIQQIAEELQSGSTASFFVTDPQGHYLIDSGDRALFSQVSSPELMERITHGLWGLVDYEEADIDKVCYLHPMMQPQVLGNHAWVLGFAQDRAEAYAILYALRLRLVAVVVGGVLLVYLLSSILSRRLSRPVKRLTAASVCVEQGQLDVRVPVDGCDELGQLSLAFNRMVEAIRQGTASNEELRAEMEKRKRVVDKLREVKEWQRLLFERAGESIFVIEPKTMKFIDCNVRACEMLGCSRDTLLAMSVMDVSLSLSTEQVASVVQSQTEFVQTLETEFIAGDGTAIPVVINSRVVHRNDVPVILAHVHDVSAQYAAAEEMKRAKELAESANMSKDLFLASISHEMRTPLFSVMGYAEQIIAKGDDVMRSMAQPVYQESHHLLMLINDLLDHAKIAAGKLEFIHEPFDLHGMLESIHLSMALEARRKGIAFDVECGSDVPALFSSDALRLRQILTNLVANAIKFTEQGRVVIRVELLDASCVEGAKLLRFGVEDTGIGIAKEQQGRIFEAFTQAERDTGRKYGGTGLGIAIARSLVEGLGGRLHLESSVGEGSTFSFEIHLKTVTAAEGARVGRDVGREFKDIRNAFNGHVLVAEDYEVNQRLLSIQLEDLGFSVDMVADGEDAVEAAEHTDYALIFLDLEMERMGGLEAARRIRRGRRNVETPLIALSAHSYAAMARQVREAGMDSLVSKPVTVESLYRCAEKWIKPSAPAFVGSEQNGPRPAVEMETDDAAPVLDWDRGVTHFNGNVEIYKDSVRNVILTAETKLEEIRQAIAQEDRGQIFRAVHLLRGGAANIAAAKLNNVSERIESLVMEEVDVPRPDMAMVHELEHAVRELKCCWENDTHLF